MRQKRQRLAGATEGAIDAEDVARFARLGDSWWDLDGPMAPLHKLNPTRIRYLRDMIVRHAGRSRLDPAKPLLEGLHILDIGSGGGLLSEPLARLGARVTGIDPSPDNIAAARRHADQMGLVIDYRAVTAEALAESGESFDTVLAMEVVEHVPEPARFIRTACALVQPGGLFFLSTLNRTPQSFLLGIVAAEYVLGWLPRGTHRWSQFVKPEEVAAPVRASGLRVIARTGVAYDPLRDQWNLSRAMDVNYMIAAVRAVAEDRPAVQPRRLALSD